MSEPYQASGTKIHLTLPLLFRSSSSSSSIASISRPGGETGSVYASEACILRLTEYARIMHAYTSMQLACGSVYNASKSLRTHSPASANARAFADNRARAVQSDRQPFVCSGDETQSFRFFEARGAHLTATADGPDSKLDIDGYWIEEPVVSGDGDMAVGVVGATPCDTHPGMPRRRRTVALGAGSRNFDESSGSLSDRQSMDVKLGSRGLERMISMRERESKVVSRDWAV